MAKRKATKGISARAWFYGQSFNGRLSDQKPPAPKPDPLKNVKHPQIVEAIQ